MNLLLGVQILSANCQGLSKIKDQAPNVSYDIHHFMDF